MVLSVNEKLPADNFSLTDKKRLHILLTQRTNFYQLPMDFIQHIDPLAGLILDLIIVAGLTERKVAINLPVFD